MGSSSSKSAKAAAKANAAQGTNAQNAAAAAQPSSVPPPPQDRLVANAAQTTRPQRTNRSDLPFLGLVRDRDGATTASDRPRETRQEREARKVEKERQARLKEREKSLREEHIDGGYLVTLGTYTGPEDFSKPIVRQLQIERRLAPFWRGLNEHSDSWTEAQLVAVARALPIPAPDEIPAYMARTNSESSSLQPRSDANVNSLTIPISSRSQSHDSTTSGAPSPIYPTLSSSGPTASSTPSSSTAQLFRGRAKTLASLASGTKGSPPDLTPQEIQLPKDPNVNGQPIEAYLYKDAAECPICFMYYPPYLNKTRCCDQPICSECFVQIKRPDPHPPEHEQPGQQRPPEEEAELLVSEVAACPFCVTPEFGITYDPPPFRRGLAYAKRIGANPLQNSTSAMSSSSSLHTPGRRRATSLSANDPLVITTDRVRPDWAKKLADARAHVLRRSAAATALHNAAYVLGNQGMGQLPVLPNFRRRRSLFADGLGTPGNLLPRAGPGGVLVSPYTHINRVGGEGDDGNDITPPRGSSRRSRVDDIEELMMMEAIRLSLAAEEDRKRKEEKEAKKDAKKKAKEEKRDAKQAEKLAKKSGASTMPLLNDSSSSMARSNSNLGVPSPPPEELVQGKGKAPAQDFAGFIPLLEPTSTLNTEMKDPDKSGAPSKPRSDTLGSVNDDPQKHLEESRANLHPSSGITPPEPSLLSPHTRQLSETASMTSSANESVSPASSTRAESPMSTASGSGLDVPSTSQTDSASVQRSGTPPVEPMLNFRSLTAMIEDENKDGREGENVEDTATASKAEEDLKEPSPTGSPRIKPTTNVAMEGNRSRGNSGESSASPPPPVYATDDDDQITPAPAALGVVHDVDAKGIGSIDVLDRGHATAREATQ